MLQNLKQLREKHHVTQQQLASAVGVSQQSINKYENHNIEPDIDTLIAIADYFHISVDYLLGHVYIPEDTIGSSMLTQEELDLISKYRYLSPKEKASIHMIMDTYRLK